VHQTANRERARKNRPQEEEEEEECTAGNPLPIWMPFGRLNDDHIATKKGSKVASRKLQYGRFAGVQMASKWRQTVPRHLWPHANIIH
jgi:hypothetical protein